MVPTRTLPFHIKSLNQQHPSNPTLLSSAWQKTLFSRAEAVLADQFHYILQPDCSANAHRIGHFPAQTSPFP